MHTLLQDFRYSIRQLRTSPGFAVAAILTLAIGIGANTVCFTILDALVLRPIRIPELDRVVTLDEHLSDNVSQRVSFADFQDWWLQGRSFQELAAQEEDVLTFTGTGNPEHLQATMSTANLFDLLRVQPVLGRTFRAGEDEPGRNQEAVLSFPLWQRSFAADPGIIGHSVTLNGLPYTIVGVMPQGFRYASASDIFLPLALKPQQKADRRWHSVSVIGRLNPGVSLLQAQAELQTINAVLAKEHPDTNLGWSIRLRPLADTVNGEFTKMYMQLMMGASLFVLLIVCANVSNLQFSRSLARQAEISIRSAMGAGRRRLLRQLLTESVLLSSLGAIAGLVLASGGLHLVLVSMPQAVARFVPGWTNLGLNGFVLSFSLLTAMAAGVFSGLAPASAALRVNVADQLKTGGRSVSSSVKAHRLRSLFAITQIALSIALVMGAVLMATGMRAMLFDTRRFDPAHLLTFDVRPATSRYTTRARQAAFYDQTLSKIRAIPGVISAELTTEFPYNNTGGWRQDFAIENVSAEPGEIRRTQRVTVTPTYLAGMHLPLLSGRWLSDSDSADTLPVIVVSHTFAARYFPNQNVIGKKIRLGKDAPGNPWYTVVGVTGDVVLLWVDRVPLPTVYLSVAQAPPERVSYAIRTTGDPLSVAPTVRQAIASIDPAMPLDDVETLQTVIHDSLVGLSYVVVMFAVDAGIALLLCAIGIFGVMANTVVERTREIGVRMALGAKRTDIERMMMRRGLVLTGAGLAFGLPLAAALARLVSNLIVGIDAGNRAIFALTALTVAVVAFFAAWLPARRAAGIEPVIAMRGD